MTHFSVDVQQDDGRRNRQEDTRRRRGGVAGMNEEDGADEADGETLFRVDLNEGLLYWIA